MKEFITELGVVPRPLNSLVIYSDNAGAHTWPWEARPDCPARPETPGLGPTRACLWAGPGPQI
jgi:hypothetical protein